MHPGDLARGCSDLEMTWLLCCAGAATVHQEISKTQLTSCTYEIKCQRHHLKGNSVIAETYSARVLDVPIIPAA